MTEIRFAQIEPTTRCNMTCGFCTGRSMVQGDLPLESFRRILELHPHLEHIELQGEGEPVLNKDFLAMLELARARNIQVSLITNGSLLTPQIIDAFLEHQVASVHFSLETTKAEMFREIRGAKLEKMLDGLERLVKGRQERGLTLPKIGLAVTVLKKTLDAMPGIVELYQQADLDGGIFVQPLQKMAAYTGVYDEDMTTQLLSHEDLSAYNKGLRNMDGMKSILRRKKNISAFYRSLGQSLKAGEVGCPWLVHGTFIAFTGHVMPCCIVKDTALYSLGEVGKTPTAALDRARAEMNQRLVDGDIPTPCEGCGIANRFAKREGAS